MKTASQWVNDLCSKLDGEPDFERDYERAKDGKETFLLESDIAAVQHDAISDLVELLDSTANMLRGMTLDPSIPAHAKEGIRHRVEKIDAAVAEASEV